MYAEKRTAYREALQDNPVLQGFSVSVILFSCKGMLRMLRLAAHSFPRPSPDILSDFPGKFVPVSVPDVTGKGFGQDFIF